MTYEALIIFTRGPSFGWLKVSAPRKEDVKNIAIREAQGCGYNEKVKKVDIREVR